VEGGKKVVPGRKVVGTVYTGVAVKAGGGVAGMSYGMAGDNSRQRMASKRPYKVPVAVQWCVGGAGT